jgi:hypothetical protein
MGETMGFHGVFPWFSWVKPWVKPYLSGYPQGMLLLLFPGHSSLFSTFSDRYIFNGPVEIVEIYHELPLKIAI